MEFLGLPDGIIEYGVPLRRDLARVVRRHRPEIVITNNFRDTWDGAVVLNQTDHTATGRAVLDAVRDAGNRWVFTELLDEAYLRGLGSGDFDAREFLEGLARAAGVRLGARYGASFEVFHFDLF